MSEPDDLDNVTEETIFKYFAYEKEWANHLYMRIEKLLEMWRNTKMSEYNRVILTSQMMTLTKAVVDDINALSADAGSSEIVSRIEKC